jgi:hypothetical protein
MPDGITAKECIRILPEQVESKVGEGSPFYFILARQEMGVKDAKLETGVVS